MKYVCTYIYLHLYRQEAVRRTNRTRMNRYEGINRQVILGCSLTAGNVAAVNVLLILGLGESTTTLGRTTRKKFKSVLSITTVYIIFFLKSSPKTACVLNRMYYLIEKQHQLTQQLFNPKNCNLSDQGREMYKEQKFKYRYHTTNNPKLLFNIHTFFSTFYKHYLNQRTS